MHPWHDWGGWGMGWMGMWLFWLVLFALVIWALMRRAPRDPIPEGPEDIVRKRFARGEIDATEFKNLLDELRKG